MRCLLKRKKANRRTSLTHVSTIQTQQWTRMNKPSSSNNNSSRTFNSSRCLKALSLSSSKNSLSNLPKNSKSNSYFTSNNYNNNMRLTSHNNRSTWLTLMDSQSSNNTINSHPNSITKQTTVQWPVQMQKGNSRKTSLLNFSKTPISSPLPNKSSCSRFSSHAGSGKWKVRSRSSTATFTIFWLKTSPKPKYDLQSWRIHRPRNKLSRPMKIRKLWIESHGRSESMRLCLGSTRTSRRQEQEDARLSSVELRSRLLVRWSRNRFVKRSLRKSL